MEPMEADSTTHDKNQKASIDESRLPFLASPHNLKLYKEFIEDQGNGRLEYQIIQRLQSFGLLPKNVKCSAAGEDCRVVSKNARVVDRVQWVCEGCGTRQPIRTGSFFLKLQSSILQTLQMILAWCEDADCFMAAEHFGVKPRVASGIYDKLDELAVKEYNKSKLGGDNSVVLVEMYPDCLNRLSPDTTDQPHIHRILMIADTNHVPTKYWLHVLKQDLKKSSCSSMNNQALKAEVQEVLSQVTLPNSDVVTGFNVPVIEGAATIQHLIQYCDVDMQNFLSSRLWRQAVSLCSASRDVCAGASAPSPSAVCAAAVQRYLSSALYRRRHDTIDSIGFYHRILTTIATHYTQEFD